MLAVCVPTDAAHVNRATATLWGGALEAASSPGRAGRYIRQPAGYSAFVPAVLAKQLRRHGLLGRKPRIETVDEDVGINQRRHGRRARCVASRGPWVGNLDACAVHMAKVTRKLQVTAMRKAQGWLQPQTPIGSITQVSHTPPQKPSWHTADDAQAWPSGTQPQSCGEVARQRSPAGTGAAALAVARQAAGAALRQLSRDRRAEVAGADRGA